jgi:nitrile hydratase
MNGIHDMGGMHGFGPVLPEPDEPVFHAEWERRGFALVAATPGAWTLDEDRHVCVNRQPGEYLSMRYYEIWLSTLETLLVKHGHVTRAEIEAGCALEPAHPATRPLRSTDVEASLAAGSPAEREPRHSARFAAGDPVRARTLNPTGHTRLPRYVRGCTGTVRCVRGCHVFPDTNAHGLGEQPHWLYSVALSACTLWGEAPNPRDEVLVDLWEPYLEAE